MALIGGLHGLTIGPVTAGMTMGTWWAFVGMSIAAMGFYGSKGPFWGMPPMFLTGTAAATPNTPSRLRNGSSAPWRAAMPKRQGLPGDRRQHGPGASGLACLTGCAAFHDRGITESAPCRPARSGSRRVFVGHAFEPNEQDDLALFIT